MAKVRIDRASIFLGALGLLFIWQQASFLGVGVPDPFNLIPKFVDFTFLRGFSNTLREVIFVSGSGYVLGIGIAWLVLRSSALSRTIIQFLRLGLWLPFLFFFVFPQYIGILGVSAATLCVCYAYLTRRIFFVGEDGPAVRIQAAREALLQSFFLILLAEIWWSNWLANWLKLFETATLNQCRAVGVGVLGVVLIFVWTVNWFCRYSFENSAALTATVVLKQLTDTWASSFGALIILIGCLLTWQMLSTPISSPAAAIDATVYLFRSGEIWNDIRTTLGGILGGLMLSVILALMTSKVLSERDAVRRALSWFLPLTYLTPVILYMLSFFIFLSRDEFPTVARIVFVGGLSFYPLVNVFWGLRGEPSGRRIFLAVDYALPTAIVGALIGELYATTAGVGFLMVVATATNQPDKAFVGFLLLTFAALVLSSIFRTIGNRLSSFGRAEATIPAPTN